MEDVEQIRLDFRAAVAALASSRPNLDLIHLFVAAPVSVCFALGQELKARNSAPIQTYRFRTVSGQSRYQPALLIGEGSLEAMLPPTAEEAARAERARFGPLASNLDDVLKWAREQREQGAESRPWFSAIPVPEVAAATLFPRLPALRVVVTDGAQLDKQSVTQEYGYDKDRRLWELSDRLILGWQGTLGDDGPALRQAGRLFFFHEYVHDYQTLTASTAREVGKFGSVLEHVDYVADVYALVHELGFMLREGSTRVEEPAEVKALLDALVETMVCAMWAFAPSLADPQWEGRRLRRFLNWYSRQIQIRRTSSLAQALELLGRVPRIEVGGIHQLARGRRIIARLDRRDPTTHLELGLVLEDERMFRLGDSANTSLAGLLDAFQHGRHHEIQAFFKSAFEFAQQTGGALPA
jgi:SMODS-associated and fused to various effectors sensor domain